LLAVFGDLNSVAPSTKDVRDYLLVVWVIFGEKHAKRATFPLAEQVRNRHGRAQPLRVTVSAIEQAADQASL
jgi:Asp-tRNA(Asn)/Glu-tRNA(Gln) amidotransferase A subunit family amidase